MATALILFTQGANTDVAGKAVLGEVNEPVTVTNGSNTGVVGWKIYLLDAPPDSATFPPASQPQILAQAVDNTPTVAFTPDVAGTYRVMLEVTDASSVVDRDIRCFGVPDVRGFVRPPYQQNPEPLPLQLPGIITREPRPIKPDEQNYGANVRGWSGNGAANQLDAFFRRYADLPPATVTTTPYTATESDPPLLVIDIATIGGPATVNLPLSPRTGFVARIAISGSGFPVTIQAQGGGTVGGLPSLEVTSGGIVLVHQESNEWALLSGGGGVEPLSNTFYVDLNTTAVSQDGSIDSPFDTLTAAIAAASAGDAILIVPGDYSPEAPFTIGKNLTIAAVYPTPVGIAGLGSFFNGLVSLGDVTISSGMTLFGFGLNIATLDLADSAAGVVLDSSSVTAVTGDGSISGWNSNLPLPIECSVLVTYNCQLTGLPATITLTGQICDLAYSQVAGGSTTIEFTGSAGTLNVDDYSNYWIRQLEAGPGFTLTNGQKVVVGASAVTVGYDASSESDVHTLRFGDASVTVAAGVADIKQTTCDEFLGGTGSAISSSSGNANIGALNWNVQIAFAGGEVQRVASTADMSGVYSVQAVTTGIASIYLGRNPASAGGVVLSAVRWFGWRGVLNAPDTSSGIDLAEEGAGRMGLGTDAAAQSFGAAGIFFETLPDVDAFVRCVTRDGALETVTVTAVLAANVHDYRIQHDADGVWSFYIDQALVATHDLPNDADVVPPDSTLLLFAAQADGFDLVGDFYNVLVDRFLLALV